MAGVSDLQERYVPCAARSALMVVGEQPGDRDDREGIRSPARPGGGPVESELAPRVLATIHPSATLRADPAIREDERAAFVRDLEVTASFVSA